MRSTTAELMISPPEGRDFIGPAAGLNPTHYLLLRENSTPGWLLVPGDMYNPEGDRSQTQACIPSHRVLEDGLVFAAACAVGLPSVRASFGKVVDLTASHIQIPPHGLPEDVYETCARSFSDAHIAIVNWHGSLIERDLPLLSQYGFDLELFRPSFSRRRHRTGETVSWGVIAPDDADVEELPAAEQAPLEDDHSGSFSLPLPPSVDRPLFVYGSLKPNELAHGQIAAFVASTEPAWIQDHVLKLRDGLPILVHAAGGEVEGNLVNFSSPEAGYAAVAAFEPKEHYRWVEVVINGTPTNALLGLKPSVGVADEPQQRWTSREDPVLAHGLTAVARIYRTSGIQSVVQDFVPGFSSSYWPAFFDVQSAFLLLMTVVERYTALAFGPRVKPMARIGRLEDSPTFRSAFAEASVEIGGRVVDSRNPDKKLSLKADGKGAWAYWYQVRSNLSHRGKGAFRDAALVASALIDVHDVMRLILLDQVRGIGEVWAQSEPAGVETRWLLRGSPEVGSEQNS